MTRDMIPVTRIGGHQLLRFLTSFPIAFFSGALMTDIAYWQTENTMWANFSAWLLAVGVAIGGMAALVGLITLLTSRAARAHRPLLPLIVGGGAVLALALFDNLVHSRDQWTSVVPVGLVLSACTVAVMLITVWLGSAAREITAVPVDTMRVRP